MIIDYDGKPTRLDLFLHEKFNDRTRSFLKNLIVNGDVLVNGKTVKAGYELKTGDATIYTVTEDNKVEEYKINITKIDKSSKIKNIYFEITDRELLETTGGIVQGMSGSPIIQDNKIFGAVTHVVIDDVKSGYGIFITSMREEGEK